MPLSPRAQALADLDALYTQAEALLTDALAASGRERLSLTWRAVQACRQLDLLLNRAGIAPMAAR